MIAQHFDFLNNKMNVKVLKVTINRLFEVSAYPTNDNWWPFHDFHTAFRSLVHKQTMTMTI